MESIARAMREAPGPLAAASLLAVFSLLSTVDGLYLHLWRYKLHTRPESQREHLLHTGRAILFPGWAWLLFALPTGGALLWTGVGLALADQALGIADTLCERDSRRSIGGLSSREYALHVTLTTFHAAALAIALASRPWEAWLPGATAVDPVPYPDAVRFVVANLVLGGVVVAALHVWLAARFRAPTRPSVPA